MTAEDAQTTDSIDPRVSAFVGRKADYYGPIWESFGDPISHRISFNVSAAFLSGFWLLYRKLYIPFTIFVMAIMADVTLSIYLEDNRLVPAEVIAIWDRLSPFIYGAVVGIWGNYWYFRKFKRLDRESRSSFSDPASQEKFLRSKGGGSLIGPVAFLLLIVAILYLSFQAA